MFTSFRKTLALAATVLIFGAGHARANLSGSTISNSAFNTIPVTVVGTTKATVMVNGQPYKPGATIQPGQSITVTGGSAVLDIGTTEVTANDGSSMQMHAGSQGDPWSGIPPVDPSFSLTKGTINVIGSTLSSGSILSTVEDNAYTAVLVAEGDLGLYTDNKELINEVVNLVPTPAQASAVISPSAPH